MYQIELSDTTTSATMPMLEVPLTEDQIEGTVDVTTLDMNVYTDFFAKKRAWSHEWESMTEAEFETLKGFYDRQFTLFQYPTLTIDDLGVDNVVVRMELGSRQIYDHCGNVQNVRVTFRETVQMTTDWEP